MRGEGSGSGRGPTGSQDPFGLRRAAIAALRLWERVPELTLEGASGAAIAGYEDLLGEDAERARALLPDFLSARLQARAEDEVAPRPSAAETAVYGAVARIP